MPRQVAIGGRRERIEARGALQRLCSRGILSLPFEHDRQPIQGIGLVRIHRQRPAQQQQGLLLDRRARVTAEQHQSLHGIGRSELRFQRQRRVDIPLRLVVLCFVILGPDCAERQDRRPVHVSLGELRIQFNGPGELFGREAPEHGRAMRELFATHEVVLIRFQVRKSFLVRRWRNLRHDAQRHGFRDLILQRKDAAQRTVKAVAPHLHAVAFNELGRDPELPAIAPHAALQEILHAQQRAHAGDVKAAFPKRER